MTISRNLSILAEGAAPTAVGNIPFTTDGSTWSSTQKIVRGTSVATTSGTSISFTGIPSWVKRITLMLNEVSISGTSGVAARIGSGSFVTSGYVGFGMFAPASGTTPVGYTAGTATLDIAGYSVSTQNVSAYAVLNNITGNVWTFNSLASRNAGTSGQNGPQNNNYIPTTLSGTLDRIQIVTGNGTDTFDAGSVNIFYE